MGCCTAPLVPYVIWSLICTSISLQYFSVWHKPTQVSINPPHEGWPSGVGSRVHAHGPMFELWRVPCGRIFMACFAPHTLALLGCQGEICSISVTVVMIQSNIPQWGMLLLGHVLGVSHIWSPRSSSRFPKKKKKKGQHQSE